MFILVKQVNWLKRPVPVAAAATKDCPYCLMAGTTSDALRALHVWIQQDSRVKVAHEGRLKAASTCRRHPYIST